MTWLTLNNATVVIAHDEQKARERLERGQQGVADATRQAAAANKRP